MSFPQLYLTLIISLFSVFAYSQQPEDYLLEGDKQLKLNQYDSAIYLYEKGLENCQNCHDTLVGLLYAQTGKCNSLILQNEEALIYMLRALNLFEKLDYSYGKGKTLIYLAEYYRGLASFDKANLYLEQFDKLNKEENLPLELQAYYFNRKAAVVSERTGDTSEVIKYTNKVIEIAKSIEIKNLEANSYNELGFLYYNNGQKQKGEVYFNKALSLFKEIKDVQSYVGVLINLIRLKESLGNEKEAFELGLKGLELLAPFSKLYKEKKTLHLFVHSYYLSIGNYKKAMYHYKKHQKNNFIVLSEEFNEKLIKISKEYDVEKEKAATLREQGRANFAEKEVILKTKEKRMLVWYLVALFFLMIIIVYLFFRLRISNKKLENNLEQKNILFQELHHRVKNNLTLLNSLLFLRAKRSKNEEVKEVLTECQNRIHSIALVHQNLYQVEDTSKINICSFTSQLFHELQLQANEDKRDISVEVLDVDQEINMSVGVLVGLTLNELFTNTLKYAKPPSGKLKVFVEFKNDNQRLKITYKDNGQGLPENTTLTKNGGFGFKIIQITMDQLNTSMNYEKRDGFSIFHFSIKV